MHTNLFIALAIVCAGAFFGYLIYSLRTKGTRRSGASSTREGE
jgi:hypothetical protein